MASVIRATAPSSPAPYMTVSMMGARKARGSKASLFSSSSFQTPPALGSSFSSGWSRNSSRKLRVPARRMSVSTLILPMPQGMAAFSSSLEMP